MTDFERATPELPVFFASTEGQTHTIADRLAAVLRGEGFDSRAIDLRDLEAAHLDWARVRGAIIGASLHAGRHQTEVSNFVRSHVADLNARPSTFFSVSLSAASKNLDERRTAQDLADAFPRGLGWTPRESASVAGRLAYSKYGFFKRMVLKRIARKEGAPTDTSRDYDFTNWTQVETLARRLAHAVRDAVRMRERSGA